MKTLGGRQFWGDVRFFHGWKIQQNVLTKHYRLLDPKDTRYASGSLERCEEKLEEIRKAKELPEMTGHAVILLHGIIRSSKSMSRMQKSLNEAGFVPVPFDYPSTQANLDRCSEYLDQVLKSLNGVKKISFVTHSMGGLVVRNWLRNHKDKRLTRLVMLGTPNKGAEMADKLRNVKLFKLILGPAGQQLVSGDASDIAKLPVPEFEFACIAGARGTAEGYNPIIPGDDDGTVAVSSVMLEGAADSEVFPVLHSFLPLHAAVIKSTQCFLKSGSLRESGETNAGGKRGSRGGFIRMIATAYPTWFAWVIVLYVYLPIYPAAIATVWSICLTFKRRKTAESQSHWFVTGAIWVVGAISYTFIWKPHLGIY